MAIDFSSIVRRQLGDPPPSSRAERDAIYAEIYTTLDRMFAGRESGEEHFAASLALQKTIKQIEAGLGANRPKSGDAQPSTLPTEPKPTSTFWRLVDRLNQVWSTVEKLGRAAIIVVAVVVIGVVGFWYFWSEERELPPVQRSALEQTACKPISKEQCDYLISAIERTKSRGIIVAANAGNLAPAEAAITENARRIEADPNASEQSKRQATADAAVLSLALTRIEGQTKRVGDLIEQQSQRQERAQEAEKQKEEKRLAEIRERIRGAGYSLDATGLLMAAKDAASNTYEFEQLGIKPTESALQSVLSVLKSPAEIAYLLQYVMTKDRYAIFRQLRETLARDKPKLYEAYRNSGAKQFLCKKANYTLIVGEPVLTGACTKDGARFAADYGSYFLYVYGGLSLDNPAFVEPLNSTNFLRNAPNELPIASRGGKLVLSRFEDCQYYEGEFDFFFNGGINPWGSFQKPGSIDITYFENSDADFAKDAHERCSMSDVVGKRLPQCSARVIMVSRCDQISSRPVVVKQLNGPLARRAGSSLAAADPSPTVPPQGAAVAPQPTGNLAASDVQREILGKNLNHAGKIDITFNSNGTFASGDGRIGRNGKYQMMADGRLCWQDNLGFDGCFQYFRDNGVLKVKRNDSKSHDVIGTVKVTNR
jgi:hypothetical protein